MKHWGPAAPHTAVCERVFESHRQSVKKNLYSDVIPTEAGAYSRRLLSAI